MKIIPIVLSADNNYAPYMSVTMISILENASKDTFYDFYFLVHPKFSERNKKKLGVIEARYENCKINFILMNGYFDTLKSSIKGISTVTYYFLMLSKFIPEKYNKCIKFDCDIIVNQDLSEPYDTKLKNNYVAGVKAAGIQLSESAWVKDYLKVLEISSISQYINAGVLVFNLELMRKDKLDSIFYEKAHEKSYPTMDQSILNIVCYDKILHLPLKYNVMTKTLNEKEDKLLKLFTKSEIEIAKENLSIIHFADKIKPWNDDKSLLANQWWKYAKLSPYFSSFLIKLYFKKVKNFIYCSNKTWRDNYKIRVKKTTIFGLNITTIKKEKTDTL